MCSCTQGFVGTNTFRGRLEAVRYNTTNTHTITHTHTHTHVLLHAGLCGHEHVQREIRSSALQHNKYTHNYTHTHT